MPAREGGDWLHAPGWAGQRVKGAAAGGDRLVPAVAAAVTGGARRGAGSAPARPGPRHEEPQIPPEEARSGHRGQRGGCRQGSAGGGGEWALVRAGGAGGRRAAVLRDLNTPGDGEGGAELCGRAAGEQLRGEVGWGRGLRSGKGGLG